MFAPLNKIVELPKIVCTLTDAKYEYLNDISSSFYQLSQVVDLATARKKPATETIVSQINSLYGDSPVVAEILGKLLAKHHDTGDIRVHKIIVKPEVKVRTADEDEPKNSDDDN